MSGLGSFMKGAFSGYSFTDDAMERRKDSKRRDTRFEWERDNRAREADLRESNDDAFEKAADAADTAGIAEGKAPTAASKGLPIQGRAASSRSSRGDTSRADYAFNRFTRSGVPGHVAAGLVGNLMQESGPGIDPQAVGDGGNAYGAAQWNGPRMQAYNAYADERGAQRGDFDTQIDYLMREGETSEKDAWQAMMETGTPEDAARVGSDRFWRPGTPHNDKRAAYASEVYARNAPPTPKARPKGVRDTADEIIDTFY